MENFETKKQAAIREVMEETGLKNIKLIKKLTTTYHIYRGQSSNRRLLKPSYWYLMHSRNNRVSPQIEEDIEKVVWQPINSKSIKNFSPIYKNILDVLSCYLRLLGHDDSLDFL